jgi:voltage-gated potassium channel
VENFLEPVLIFLGFFWLIPLIIELVAGLTDILLKITTFIWVIFILDFALKFIVAPEKLQFLKKNVLTIISLIVPALRVFRLARAFSMLRTARFIRGANLVKVLGSINRGMRSLGATMKRRAFGYVALLSALVIFGGAAGIHAFEKNYGLPTYWEALWWTAMIVTTMGSEYWPQTGEGRALCFILTVYSFAIFGYFTAALASFFIETDAESSKTEVADTRQVKELKNEIKDLKALLNELLKKGKETGG